MNSVTFIAFVKRIRIVKRINVVLYAYVFRLFLLNTEKLFGTRIVRCSEVIIDRTLSFDGLV